MTALATTPTGQLLALPMLAADQVTETLHAYQVSKGGNAQACDGANTGPGSNASAPASSSPLARDELTGPRSAGYQAMLEGCPAGRAGTPACTATSSHAAPTSSACSRAERCLATADAVRHAVPAKINRIRWALPTNPDDLTDTFKQRRRDDRRVVTPTSPRRLCGNCLPTTTWTPTR